ncbi:hypothetical protein [Nocardia higoensis]|uniref:hypothetical protein n=1 Tax=Nocardia higoensis TaxID=228599 RepID=UPI0012F63476|nr:hypothetical protein [Nocardia higoensis]
MQRPVDPEIARKYPYLFGYNSDSGAPGAVGSLPWIITQPEEKKSSQADATTVEQTLVGQIVLGTGPAAPSPATSSALELIVPEAAIPSIASDVNSVDPLPSASGVPDPRATGLPDSIRDPRVVFRIGAGYPASQLIADLETIRIPPVPWVGQGAHPWDAAMARLHAAAYTPPQQLEDLKSATSDTLPCLRNEAAWYTDARQRQERQQREARRRLDEAGIPWRDPEVSEYVKYQAAIPVLTSPSEPVDSDPELSLGGVARQLGHMAVGVFAMTDLGAVVNSVGGWFGRHPNLPTSDDVAAGVAEQVEAAKAEADKGNTAGFINHAGMAIGLPDWRDPNSVVAFGIALGVARGAGGRGKPGSGGGDAAGTPAVASEAGAVGRANRNPAGWTDHIDIYSQHTRIPPSHIGKPPVPHAELPPIHPDSVPRTPIDVVGSDQPQRVPATAVGRNEKFEPIAASRNPGETPRATPKGPSDKTRSALLGEIDPSGPRVGLAGELIETIDGLVDVYRVQGGDNPPKNFSRERLRVAADGTIEILGDKMLHLNFNQWDRTLQWIEKRGNGSYIVKFKVEESFLYYLRETAVPQREGRFPENRGKAQIDDPAYPDQFGIPPQLWQRLQDNIIPGSGEEIIP